VKVISGEARKGGAKSATVMHSLFPFKCMAMGWGWVVMRGQL
jgi:hypothetical protein